MCIRDRVICIDDGSQDGTRAIVQAYARRDARVRCIAFDENRGVSSARNAGLCAARGAYIGFCDADDWADAEMYQTLYDAAQGADLSLIHISACAEASRAMNT